MKSGVIIPYGTALCLFSIIPAFYTWNNILFPILSGIFALFVVWDIVWNGTNKNKFVPALLLFFITALYAFRSDMNFNGILLQLCIVPLFFSNRKFILSLYNAFSNVFAAGLLISLPIYFLVIWLGVDLPHSVIEPLNPDKLSTYYLYPFLVVEESWHLLSPRFFAWFDEPGVVGTISAILLISDRFDLRKIRNIIILFAGLCSLSFFFFIVVGVYVILCCDMKYKIFTVFMIVVGYFILASNEVLDEMVFSRFSFKDGTLKLSGFNRSSESFDVYFNKFRFTPEYFTGMGANVGVRLNEGGSSYKQLIVSHGVILFAAYLFNFFLYSLGTIKNKKAFVLYGFVLLGTMYQRPFVSNNALIFLMIAIIYEFSINYDSKKRYKYRVSYNNCSRV